METWIRPLKQHFYQKVQIDSVLPFKMVNWCTDGRKLNIVCRPKEKQVSLNLTWTLICLYVSFKVVTFSYHYGHWQSGDILSKLNY